MGMKALVCAVFLLLTSPVAAHALARAAHRAGLKPCSKTNCDAYDEDKDLIS
jgi:multicomponent Na+:H+ antiporter subunit G